MYFPTVTTQRLKTLRNKASIVTSNLRPSYKTTKQATEVLRNLAKRIRSSLEIEKSNLRRL